MRLRRVLALPLLALFAAGCPSLAEKPAPEPAQPPSPPAAAAPVAVAPPAEPAGGCGCGSAGEARGCGSGAEAHAAAGHAAPASECGGACAGEKAGGCGCGGGEKAAVDGPLVPPAQASVGDRTKCIVSGGAFVVTPSTQWVKHEGKSFPVCCPACVGRFNADPARFLGT